MRHNHMLQRFHARELLDEILTDLLAGTHVLHIDNESEEEDLPDFVRIGYFRMSMSHTIIALYRLTEIYKHYSRYLPAEYRAALKDICKEIERRGIINFRNQSVAHIHNKATKQPLTDFETLNAFEQILDGDLSSFLQWLNDLDGQTDTVVDIVEQTRDALDAEFERQKTSYSV